MLQFTRILDDSADIVSFKKRDPWVAERRFNCFASTQPDKKLLWQIFIYSFPGIIASFTKNWSHLKVVNSFPYELHAPFVYYLTFLLAITSENRKNRVFIIPKAILQNNTYYRNHNMKCILRFTHRS